MPEGWRLMRALFGRSACVLICGIVAEAVEECLEIVLPLTGLLKEALSRSEGTVYLGNYLSYNS